MRHHIAKVTSTCFFHLRRLRKIGHILDKNSRCRLVCAFILTRIDYCNALYAELPDSTLAPLQRVLHDAVRFVVGLRARDHVTGAPYRTLLAACTPSYYVQTRLRPIPEFTDTTDTDTLDLHRCRYRVPIPIPVVTLQPPRRVVPHYNA